MEADDPIAVVIATLNSFEPARDTENLYRLYQLFEGFDSMPACDSALTRRGGKYRLVFGNDASKQSIPKTSTLRSGTNSCSSPA
jgi:hypothetical protein